MLESNGSQTRFNMSKNMEAPQRRKRVLIVGAGAAGMLPYPLHIVTLFWLTRLLRYVLRAPSLRAPRKV